MIKKNIRIFLNNLIGDKKSVSLEKRSINGISFFSMLIYIFCAPLTVFLKTPRIFTLAYLSFGFLSSILYFAARFTNKHQLIAGLLILSNGLYISFLWFFNQGLAGPATIVSLFLILLVSPFPGNQQRQASILFVLVLLGILYCVQYFYPYTIKTYLSPWSQFTINYITFVFVALSMVTLIKYILNNLRIEKEQAQKAKLQLKESEYLFKILANTTSTAIILCQDQKISYANPAAQNVFKYPLNELKRIDFSHLISINDQEKVKKNWPSKKSSKKTISGKEIRILPKSGQEKSVFFQASTIEYYNKPAQLISMIDLTKLREAQTDLFNLQNYLSNIIDSMPSLLVGIDANLNITQWNQKAAEQTNIPAKNALGEYLFKCIPRLEKETDKIKNAITQQKVQEKIRLSYEHDDQTIYEDITVFPLRKSGAEGAVIRVDEVTGKVRLEEIIIQSEKMLSIGGLAAGMAHEINNPLAGILQNVQLTKNRLTQDIPANISAATKAGTSMKAIRGFMQARKIFSQLENINIAGTRAAKIIQNMLSFAKEDTPKQRQNLADLLEKTIELAQNDDSLKKQYNFMKIKIIKDFALGLSEVLCEKDKIIQVFFNIFTNAAQAIHECNTPIKNPAFILRLSQINNMAQIEIQDNGPGMNEDIRKRIFEPFFTTKDVSKGTGLGLSLSYFIIVKDHKGEMNVESSPSNGAKFIIRLPFK